MIRKEVVMYLILVVVILLVIAFVIPTGNNKIIYIERKTGEKIKEKVPGEIYLKWLYNNPFAKIALHGAIKRKFISDYYGKKMDSINSKEKIEEFVKEYNINMEESVKRIDEFESFNDFFYRKLKNGSRTISEKEIISPADGKIIAFNSTTEIQDFFIKGKKFNIETYLKNQTLAKEFEGGAMAIIRLAPVDYHRFHFPIEGIAGENIKINGDYFSVSPIALKSSIEIFMENKREYCIVESDNLGKVVVSEIGATMVGSIEQTYKENQKIQKGDEKGYFKFGGSSVMILFQKNKIKFDEDIIRNTKNGYETYIKMGDGIGKK
jgi:phosphatidylserine decarboxylase